jgi:hypothetical protein
VLLLVEKVGFGFDVSVSVGVGVALPLGEESAYFHHNLSDGEVVLILRFKIVFSFLSRSLA